MSTLLSLGQPSTLFQFVYIVYLYGLPILLWAVYAWWVIDDQDAQAHRQAPAQPIRIGIAMLIPLVGPLAVLLLTPHLRRTYGLIAIIGLLAFLLPLAAGLWLAGGPLGPKALG